MVNRGRIFVNKMETEKIKCFEILLDILKHDLEWNSGEAKAQLLKILDSMNANDPIALKGRRKLSSIIFA